MIKGIKVSFTDEAGAVHPEGFCRISKLKLDADTRLVDIYFDCYHTLATYEAGKSACMQHKFTATSVEDLSAGSFDDLTDNIYTTLLENDPFLAGGEQMDGWRIEVTVGGGGTVTPSGNVIVDEDADQIFVIEPKYGYRIKDVLVDDVSEGAVAAYTFTDVTEEHTVEAQFEQI